MSIEQRPNGKWRARYRGLDGREHSKQFVKKADAVRFEALQKAAVARGDWLDPARSTITFAEWSEEWLSTKSVRPGTLADYESIVHGRLVPRWGTYQPRHAGRHAPQRSPDHHALRPGPGQPRPPRRPRRRGLPRRHELGLTVQIAGMDPAFFVTDPSGLVPGCQCRTMLAVPDGGSYETP